MKEQRPWGEFEILYEDENCKIKKILVLPGQKLSYQLHNKRQEFWTVVEGEGTAIVEDLTVDLTKGKSICIPKKIKHRVVNNKKENLIFIETQTGSYFGEDDIIRFEDEYGRIENND